MLVMRLTRIGKKNAPQYRIIIQEKQRSPRSKYIDQVGFYNPLIKPADIKFDDKKIKEWLEKGVQPSNTVWNMLVNAGIVKGDKRKAVSVKKKRKKEGGSEKPKAELPARNASLSEAGGSSEAKIKEKPESKKSE